MSKGQENKIGSKIKNFRTKKGLSQDRLSKAADMAVNTIVKIETGREQNPTIQTLERIARALDISVVDLLK